MKHTEIKSDMINGINSMNALGQWIKNEDLRNTIRIVQKNIKKQMKRGNRSI